MTTQSAQAFIAARDFLFEHRTDYERARTGFRWPVLDEFNWALDFFDAQAAGNARPALWIVDEGGHESLSTFEKMRERSNRVANFLRRIGVTRGDRVLVMLPNVTPLWEITLAIMKLGAVISPASTLLPATDLADRIERGDMRHVITDVAGTDKFDHVTARFSRTVIGAVAGWKSYADADACDANFEPDGVTKADDPFLLYFTSGTTAKPKMVLHTCQSYPVGHLSTMYWIGLQPGDVHWNISSPGWAKHAWSCFFAPWIAGATVFIFNQARFDAKRALRALVDYGVTSLCAPPTAWRALILEPLAEYKVPLRELVGAGEPLNPEVIARVKTAWGITIRDGYGQTETTCIIGNSPGQAVKSGAMGRPLPGYEVALLDDDGNAAAHGEISVDLRPSRPLPLMARYEGDTERTRQSLDGDFYRTSDVASRDEDGYYWYIGRNDDVFKSSDYRISPFELESLLIEHEAIAEAGVVPSSDPLRLAVPKAYLVLKPGFQPSRELALSILRFAATNVAPYKRVRRIEFAELPKTISGKIRRVELRAAEIGRNSAQRRPHEYWEEDFPELARPAAEAAAKN